MCSSAKVPSLNEENFILKNFIKKYEKSFQKFLVRSLNRIVMASMIYGVSRNETRGVGYDSDEESTSEKDDKPKTLHSHFVPSGKKMVLYLKIKPFQNLRLKKKFIPVSTMHTCMIILHRNPSLLKTLGRLTKKDP